MGEMIGMDPDEVRQLAGQLRTQGETLSTVVGHVDNLVHLIGNNWGGPAEVEFVQSWQRAHRPALVGAQSAVIGLAQSAENNATQQVDASNTTGAAGSLTGVWSRQGGTSRQQRADAAAITQATAHMTSAEQRAWWNGLSRSTRAEYLANAPGVLLALPGLAAYMQIYRQTQIGSVSEDGTATVTENFGVLKVDEGIDESVVLAKYPDGHATVTIGAGVFAGGAKEVGGDGGDASVGADGQVALGRTYEFSTEAKAQQFYDQIVNGHPSPVQLVKNIDEAAKAEDLRPVSETVSGTAEGTVSAQGGDGVADAKAQAGAAAQVVYDSKNHTETTTFTLSGSAAASVDVNGAKAQGDVQVSVIQGTHGIQSASISGDYGVSKVSGSELDNTSVGTGGSFQMDIPVNSSTSGDLHSLVDGLPSGHVDQAALDRLGSASTMVSQDVVTTGAEVGVDHTARVVTVDGSVSTEATTATSTSIKAPGESEWLPFP